jgi:hypothetical protein
MTAFSCRSQMGDNMRKSILIVAFGLICIWLVIGCSDQGKNVISGNGVITFVALEGGCWGIIMDNGAHYGISNLPESFKQEGVRVHISAKLSDTHIYFCLAGDVLIDIIDIRII